MVINTHSIQLNCDLGEGKDTLDEQIMPYIDIANIACGGHAGSIESMQRCVTLAEQFKVTIAAHLSYNDRTNFGRVRPQALKADELEESLIDQLSALKSICHSKSQNVKYIKPHGALYHDAALIPWVLEALLTSADQVFPGIPLVLQAKSKPPTKDISHLLANRTLYLEAFADRTYLNDGNLMPRSQSGAVLATAKEIVQQAIQLINEKCVTTVSGNTLPLQAHTLCIHSDTPNALTALQIIRRN